MDNFVELLGENLIRLVGATLVLVIGWFVARAIAGGVLKALDRMDLNSRVARWLMWEDTKSPPNVNQYVSMGIFVLLMAFVVIGFFQVLGLPLITEPLNLFLKEVFEYAPRILSATVVMGVAWLVASTLRFLVNRIGLATKLGERLGTQAGLKAGEAMPISKTLGDAIYWLILLLFLPVVLNALKLEGLLKPVQGMVDEVLGVIPNVFAASIILAVGWLVARILQRLVTNLSAAAGVDSLSARVGLSAAIGKKPLSSLLGLVVYILVLLPVLIAALNVLALEAITGPASDMLERILGAFPAIFAAALLLLIAFLVGRIVANLVTQLLSSAGFDKLTEKLGISVKHQKRNQKPSILVGHLTLIIIVLFATMEALSLLEFELMAMLLQDFIVFVGQVLLGLAIFGLALYLSNVVYRTISASGAHQAQLFALVARVAVLVLGGAMALQQMGLAEEIINLSFGLLFGAIAVAVAIAFGIGGRELAAEILSEMKAGKMPRPSRPTKKKPS
jgi:hypothetical protein